MFFVHTRVIVDDLQTVHYVVMVTLSRCVHMLGVALRQASVK